MSVNNNMGVNPSLGNSGKADPQADSLGGGRFHEILGEKIGQTLGVDDESNGIFNSQQVCAAENLSPLPGIGETISPSRFSQLNDVYNGIMAQQQCHPKHSSSLGW